MPQYFATSALGIEAVTAEELKALGALNVDAVRGGVTFEGDLELLYKANLWCRTATRILVPLKSFSARTQEMLYDQIRRLKWADMLTNDMTFCVDAVIAGASKRQNSEQGEGEDFGERRENRGFPGPGRDARGVPDRRPGIHNSMFAALKIKDAIVDQMRHKTGERPNVNTENPDVRIHAYFNDGKCTLSLDSTGQSLHERGYRVDGAKAPLKETLAAALVMMTGWKDDGPFIDPMCGSGTILIEAALLGLNIAPGLMRGRFGFQSWRDFDSKLWAKVVDEAQRAAKPRLQSKLLGFDENSKALAAAEMNAKRAGLQKQLTFERRQFGLLQPPFGETTGGVVLVNPPYGERLGDIEELKGLYKTMGDIFKQRMKGYRAYIFTGNLELAKSVGLKTARRHELFNGPIECRLLKYDLY